MSGTPITTSVTVSAEIRAAAAAAREAATRSRVRTVTKRAATALARAERGAESERLVVARTRLAVLRETAAPRDSELVRTLDTAQAVLARVRGDDDLGAVEAALNAADGAADRLVERDAVQREVVRRLPTAFPDSLRLEPGSVRPAPAGGVRLEALRSTGDRLAIEVDIDPANGSGTMQFDVAQAGLGPRPGVDGDRCAVERAAVAQLVPRLAAVGLQTGPLVQPPAASAARRPATRESGSAR